MCCCKIFCAPDAPDSRYRICSMRANRIAFCMAGTTPPPITTHVQHCTACLSKAQPRIRKRPPPSAATIEPAIPRLKNVPTNLPIDSYPWAQVRACRSVCACSASDEMFVALLGILKSGSHYVPLDPDFPHDRLRYMMEDCGAPLLVDRKQAGGNIADLELEQICLDQEDPVTEKWPHLPLSITTHQANSPTLFIHRVRRATQRRSNFASGCRQLPAEHDDGARH